MSIYLLVFLDRHCFQEYVFIPDSFYFLSKFVLVFYFERFTFCGEGIVYRITCFGIVFFIPTMSFIPSQGFSGSLLFTTVISLFRFYMQYNRFSYILLVLFRSSKQYGYPCNPFYLPYNHEQSVQDKYSVLHIPFG